MGGGTSLVAGGWELVVQSLCHCQTLFTSADHALDVTQALVVGSPEIDTMH